MEVNLKFVSVFKQFKTNEKNSLKIYLLTATDLEVQLLVMMGISLGMCVCCGREQKSEANT